MKLEKDQKVWVVPPVYRNLESSRGEVATVIKAGSKYVTVETEAGRTYKFNRIVWEKPFDNGEVDGSNYFAKIYESQASWRELLRQHKVRETFQSFCYGRPAFNIPIEKIEKILEILEIKVE